MLVGRQATEGIQRPTALILALIAAMLSSILGAGGAMANSEEPVKCPGPNCRGSYFRKPEKGTTPGKPGLPGKPGKPPTYTPPPESPLERCLRLAKAKGAPEDWGMLVYLCHSLYRPGTPDIDYEALARTLIVYLRLPDTPPQFGPDPAGNEWNMLAVGYPIWLWVDGPRTRTAITRAAGLEFRLTARRTATVFTLGDGTTLTCPTWTRYTSSVTPGDPSPTCGHTYPKTSPAGGYTVTATAHWTVNWSVDGHRGTIPVSYSDTSQITIGELQALVR